jgi:hypothetical protein
MAKAPSAAASADKPDDDGIFVDLRKPIMSMGQEVKRLTFREPTAEDIERYGFPLIIADEEDPAVADPMKPKMPDISFNAKSMTEHIAILSKVPMVNIRKLSSGDWLRCAYKLSVFFLQ